MRKWYEIQWAITIAVNILLMVIIFVGQTVSHLSYIYIDETFAISVGLLVISGMIWILGDIYGKK